MKTSAKRNIAKTFSTKKGPVIATKVEHHHYHGNSGGGYGGCGSCGW